MVGLSSAALATVFALGAAALGLWPVVYHAAYGPRTTRQALILTGLAYCLLLAIGDLTRAALHAIGPATALLCVYLPILTLTFFAAGHLARTVLASLAPFRR